MLFKKALRESEAQKDEKENSLLNESIVATLWEIKTCFLLCNWFSYFLRVFGAAPSAPTAPSQNQWQSPSCVDQSNLQRTRREIGAYVLG